MYPAQYPKWMSQRSFLTKDDPRIFVAAGCVRSLRARVDDSWAYRTRVPVWIPLGYQRNEPSGRNVN